MSPGTAGAVALDTSARRDNAVLERATLRRVSVRLLPFLFTLYVINFIDRTNVAIAALQMNHDLHFSAAVYSFGVGAFFFGYAPFEVPANLFLVRFGPRRWIARIMITWGAIAAAMMFMRTPVEFYVLRFALGLAEAGLHPGIIYYLTEWFPKAQRARAVARFMLALSVSGMIGNPLGGWTLGFDGHWGLRGWQWLFLIEGIPAILLGVVVLFYLTDTIAGARWLTDAQRAWLSEKLRREREVDEAASPNQSPWRGWTNPTVWLLGLVYLLVTTGSYAQTFWAPIVIRDATHASNGVVGWILGGMSAISAIAMLIAGASSDRHEERFFHAAAGALLIAIGFFVAALLPRSWGPVAGLTIVIAGARTFHPGFWCLPSLILRGTAVSLAIGLVSGLGNVGGFLGPYAVGVFKDSAGGTTRAFLLMGVIALCGAGLLLVIRGQKAFAAHRRPAMVPVVAGGATV